MKKIKSMNSCFTYLTILLFIGMIGCQGESGLNNQSVEADFDSGEFALFDFDDAMDAIEDATLEKPMGINPELFNGNFFRNGGAFGPRAPRGPLGPRMQRGRIGNHLGEVLSELDLSEEQKSQIRELMSGHRECIQEPLQAFREANQDIMDDANEERRAIIDELRNGQIDRDKAREQLRALNEITRKAIQNNPESQTASQAMCDCKLTLLDNVRAILNGAQPAAWDEWVAGLEGPCFDSDD